jgi:hypothetical protein
MKVLEKVVISETEPPQTNVLWIKPVKGNVEFRAFFYGEWKTVDSYESKPGPDTVGTEQIIDNSVIMDDLNDSVKEKIQKTYYKDDEELHMDYDIWQQQIQDNG